MIGIHKSTAALVAAVLAAAMLAGCGERPPMASAQVGYRGTGMEQITNPRIAAKTAALAAVPEAPPPAPQDGPKARDVYQNVQVLGHLSVAEFARTMNAITAAIAPTEGCGYCHNLQNLAEEGKYTKTVSRRMLQMTQHVNADWVSHHNGTGVTCWTCHRGNAVPTNVWFQRKPPLHQGGMLGNDGGQNKAAESTGLASLPYDYLTAYVMDNKQIPPIRVNGPTALPTGNRQSIKQAEHTYGLMMHMSGSLGVNCTYCHNTRSFQSWEGPATRVNAWYGIRMVGDLNANYLMPLTSTFPANRLGPTGDVAKVNCATCHQGQPKPLNGVAMAKDYPAYQRPPEAAASSPIAVAPPDLAAPAPGPDLAGVLGKVFFDTGKTAFSTLAQDTLRTTAAALVANPTSRVAISGYADQSGTPDANLELAKQRAMAVRDALKAAGVAEDRIELRKPEFAVGGAESDARRVEIISAR